MRGREYASRLEKNKTTTLITIVEFVDLCLLHSVTTLCSIAMFYYIVQQEIFKARNFL